MGAITPDDVRTKPDYVRTKADSESFAEFFERDYPSLVRALVPVTHSLQVAEEVGQEAMTKVFERWARAKEFDSPIGYAYTIAVNLNRRRARTKWIPFFDDGQGSGTSLDPAATLMERELLLRALHRLSPTERDTLLMVSYLGMTVAEVAEVSGLEPVSVRSRLHRARTSLRAALSKEEEQDGA